jgi:hypothetical protein
LNLSLWRHRNVYEFRRLIDCAHVVPVLRTPVSPEGDTDLRLAAETVWLTIVDVLGSAGMTIDDAVNAANLKLELTYNGTNIPEEKQRRFKVVGKHDLKLR